MMRIYKIAAIAFFMSSTILAIQQSKIELIQPKGIRFTIPDDGYSLVAIHFSINTPLPGTQGGQYNIDLRQKTGSSWVYENTNINVGPGDVVNYWLYALKDGRGVQILDQSVTMTDNSGTGGDSGGTGGNTGGTDGSGGTGGTDGSGGTGGNTGGTDGSGGTGGNTGGTDGSGGTGGNTGTTTTTTSNGCQSYPCLIFEDNFDFLNHDVWEHEINAGGGGNWEFQYYTNNRSNSYTRDGVLYIKPTLTADRYGENFLYSGTLDLWGAQEGNMCTGNAFWGCSRQGSSTNILNPIQSARIRSSRGFNFKYGKVEIEAKMPKGDWLWPAIWMLPKWYGYGNWPASGEIDIVEARGNMNYRDGSGKSKGVNTMGSTIHFGPNANYNRWYTGHVSKTLSSGNFADSWHKYGLEWDENSLKFFLDGAMIMDLSPPAGGFWEHGRLENTNVENPWRYATKMAPFDQEFFLIFNVAVGGTAYFPDHYSNSPYPKPWSDRSGTAPLDFWKQKNNWYPTWNPYVRNGEDAAMKVNYVKVWKLKA